jgi:tetratricopeptide (TPR) repeat protein/YHS domain-containing protein
MTPTDRMSMFRSGATWRWLAAYVGLPFVLTAQALAGDPNALKQAQELERQGKVQAARAAYERLAARFPTDAAVLHRLAVVCTRDGDHAVAADFYNRALEQAPENVELLTDAGFACYLRKEYTAAEPLLVAALEQQPKHERAANNLGLVLGMQGRMTEALAAFERVQSRASAFKNLSVVYQQQGYWAEAVTCYERAQQLDPQVVIPAKLVAKAKESQQAARSSDPKTTSHPVPAATLAKRVTHVGKSELPELDAVAHPPKTAWEEADTEPEFAAPLAAEGADVAKPETSSEAVEKTTAEADVTSPFAEPLEADPVVAADETSGDNVSDAGALPVVEPRWPMPEVAAAEPATTEPAATEPAVAESLAEQPEFAPPTPALPESPAEPTEASAFNEPIVAQVITSEPEPAAESTNDAALMTPPRRLLRDVCLVTLRDELKLVAGNPEIQEVFGDRTYCFISTDAAGRFRNDPKRYVPAANGLDLVAVSGGETEVDGDLDHAVWYREQLFVFSTQENLELFRREPQAFLTLTPAP